MDSLGAWLYNELSESQDFDGEYTGAQLHSRYIGYCDSMKLGGYERKAVTALGLYLKKMGVPAKVTSRANMRDFSDTAQIKELFTLYHKIDFKE